MEPTDAKLHRAAQLRGDPKIHYNCSQSVLIPFCEEMGIDPDLIFRLAANLGGGLRMGSTCGALAGGLMVLGLKGCGMDKTAALIRRFKENHAGLTDCAALLKAGRAAGETNQQAHCDALVYEVVAALEELTAT